jgi:hypothetical protein
VGKTDAHYGWMSGIMSTFPRYHAPEPMAAPAPCKHPKVKIVARDEDAEYVECSLCGEVFDSSEFHDMQIEETKLAQQDDN